MHYFPLLKRMADGEFHSGESLGRAMGVSRTAVWKQLQRLGDETGLPIEAVRGRGYRLAGGLELLEADRLLAHMSATSRPLVHALHIIPTTNSTNDLAMEAARTSPVCGLVVTAEQQAAGRGRRGRQWVSPFAQNIYCSLLWTFEQGARTTEGLSLAVGVAIAEGLADIGISDIKLKWPNDILWQGQKLGGILLELAGDLAGPCHVVIGFGINVAMRPGEARAIDQPWTDVQSAAGGSVSRNRILAAILSRLLPLLSSYESDGFARWHAAWDARDALRGRPVTVQTAAAELAGKAQGVATDGALRVLTAEGEQLMYGGEVSVRASV